MQLKRLTTQVRARLTPNIRKARNFAEKRPILSFAIVLGLLFLTIALSNFLTRPKAEEKKAEPAKKVDVYAIGTAPKLMLQGQVEKTGVIPIVAQNAGVVQEIYGSEGSEIAQGNWILSLSTNYQGGNAPSLQRQLAAVQFQNIKDTYQTQLDLIANQRNLATASATNAQNLVDIANQSESDTQNLVNLNASILASLNQNLTDLEATNQNGSNDALILSTKQIIAQVTAGQNQATGALRNTQYQTESGEPPTQLPEFQKEVALKQLDIQEKALKLSKEMSRLQLQLAQVMEGTMFPSAPFTGTVQKIFVRPGQVVSPGTPLAVLSSSNSKAIKITVYVSKDIAGRISKLEPSTLNLGSTTLELNPTFVSTEAVNGNLYSVSFVIPDGYQTLLTDKEYITVGVPIGYAQTSVSDPYLPIDAIYQTPTENYIYIVKNGKAVSQKVTLGQIFGSFVEVQNGLKAGDKVITNRTIISGDHVLLK